MDGSIHVAVRIRPPNQRERNAQSASITECRDACVAIRDPATNKTKNFAFNYAYGPQIEQETIFADIGSRAVNHVLEGYNCTIFAYGQTSSGKTFTMMGTEERQGLVPRIMSSIFERLAIQIAAGTCLLSVSYAEIYIEQIFDLLSGQRESLTVREHPVLGPYVEGLKQTAVSSAEQAMGFVASGNRHRSTCETAMNRDSSRSHAIIMLQIAQRTGQREIQSRLSMVDLAGSERIFDSKVQGIHKQEALKINKSLSCLSRVIKQLSEKQQHVSYRDSNLTFLLKDSLGGNSLTYMVATCSPAALNYAETLNTLRYATSALHVVNKPKINEHSDKAVVAILEREIDELRKEIARQKASASVELIGRLQQDIRDREHLMREREKSWEERLKESQKMQTANEQEIKTLNAELGKAVEIGALNNKLCTLEDTMRSVNDIFAQFIAKFNELAERTAQKIDTVAERLDAVESNLSAAIHVAHKENMQNHDMQSHAAFYRAHMTAHTAAHQHSS